MYLSADDYLCPMSQLQTIPQKTANERYQTHASISRAALRQIQSLLDAHALKQQKEPGDWGHVGVMAEVKDKLLDIFTMLA